MLLFKILLQTEANATLIDLKRLNATMLKLSYGRNATMLLVLPKVLMESTYNHENDYKLYIYCIMYLRQLYTYI